VAVRNRVAEEAGRALADVGPVAAASMEVPGGPDAGAHGPLLAEVLASPGFDTGDVVIAPLFLLPGRHAGPSGDLARIARAAQERSPSLRCHFTDLVGSHPRATEALSAAVAEALAAGVQP
jgi:sirohydrochlorin ferrochelatase